MESTLKGLIEAILGYRVQLHNLSRLLRGFMRRIWRGWLRPCGCGRAAHFIRRWRAIWHLPPASLPRGQA
ncbi:hypothetical protein [Mucilaginibacter sp.]|uniref:hypothetical protein n=1 Tax=Mucilaginibacter sp. TaxID=1882438 RepID=UPI002D7F8A45|nr:hypothetical protein [Mucilaginibacter sp.]